MADDAGAIRKLESTKALHQTMAAYFGRLRAASESPGGKVAWCSSVGPVELLTALGFAIHFPENHAAIIGSLKAADRCIPAAVASGYSPEVCSYLTSDVGIFLKGETPLVKYGFAALPRPHVLVYNTNQCHEVKEWFSFYARHYRVPLVGIHTPLNVDEVTPEVVRCVSAQYHGLVPELERVAGRRFDLERFKEATAASREACVLWRRVLETARHRPSPLTFFDASIHMGPVVVMRGTKPAVDYYRVLLSELEGRIKNGIGALPDERHRLYWEGMPIWFKLSGLARLFSKLSSCIVASTYCSSWVFDDLDPDDPFDSSALAYTKLFIARSERVKEEVLERLLGEYAVDGIIYHEAKTCPRNSNNRFGLPGRLHRRTGIPFLEIQGDVNDGRCYGEEQGATAIETFIGQIEMRG